MGNHDAELSLVITDDTAIAELNRRYLGREGPTNVIAFPMAEGDYAGITPGLLGDVVISLDTARREAQAAGLSVQERFTQLLVHGILHLLGYDHESSAAAAAEMAAREAEVLSLIKEDAGR